MHDAHVIAPDRPRAAMWATTRWLFAAGMVLMAFSTRPGFGPGVIGFGLPLLAIVAGLYVMGRLRDPAVDVQVVPYVLLGLMLAGALVVGTVHSPTPTESVARLLPNLLGFLLFAYVLSPFLPERRTVPAHVDVARIIVATGAVIGGYFVIRFVTAVMDQGLAAVVVDRVTGGVYSLPWGATNVVASPLILPIFLTFHLTRTSTGGARLLAMAARLVMMAAVAVTLSRAASASVIVGLLMLVFVAPSGARGQVVAFLAVLMAAVAIADWRSGGAVTGPFIDQVRARLEDSDVTGLNNRVEIWSQFLDAFRESPWLGIGYYASPLMFGASGHNVVLTSLVERGVIGFLLSSAILAGAAWYWFQALRAAPTEDARLFAVVLGVGGASSLMHLMFEDANFTQPYMVLSWVALALPFLAWRHSAAARSVAPSSPMPARPSARVLVHPSRVP